MTVTWKEGETRLTGELLQFIVMREVPDNQRPEVSYDVEWAMIMRDNGKIVRVHPDHLSRI